MVRIVLWRNRAKYNVAIRLPAYVPDTNRRDFENACRKNTMKPVRKQKLYKGNTENAQKNELDFDIN